MNWISFAMLIGGAVTVLVLIRPMARGAGWARALLLMVTTGCLLGGALTFTRYRSANPRAPDGALQPGIRTPTAPPGSGVRKTTAHLDGLTPAGLVRDRASAGPHRKPPATTASPEGWVFESTGGEATAIAQYRREKAKNNRSRETHPVGMAVAALAVIACLYIIYLFLDAGTRGHFTWILRITSIVAFALICFLVALARQRM